MSIGWSGAFVAQPFGIHDAVSTPVQSSGSRHHFAVRQFSMGNVVVMSA
jgi:hypothetical protein